MKSSLESIQKKIELLEMLVSERWLSCEQAASLIVVVPDAILARARAATLLFSRIVDLENFITLIDSLSRDDQAECVRRLGWLNIFDPVQPDRQYPPLDLAVHDERELVQLLSQLALNEGHDCWKRPSYRVSSTESRSSSQGHRLPLPGWGNPDATGEESLKHHGVVRLKRATMGHGATIGVAEICIVWDEALSPVSCDTRRLPPTGTTSKNTKIFGQKYRVFRNMMQMGRNESVYQIDIPITHRSYQDPEAVDDHDGRRAMMKTSLGIGRFASPRRRQPPRPPRGSGDSLYKLIALLVCFQCVVVMAIVSLSVVSHGAPATHRTLATSVMEAKTTAATGSPPRSASDQLNAWLEEFLNTTVVPVTMNTTSSRHKGFELRGTIVPRSTQPSLLDGEFAFITDNEPQHIVVMVQNKCFEWLTSGEFNERLEQSGCLEPAQLPPLHELRHTIISYSRWGPNGAVDVAYAGEMYRAQKTSQGFEIEAASGMKIHLQTRQHPPPALPDFVFKLHDLAPCPVLFSAATESSQQQQQQQLLPIALSGTGVAPMTQEFAEEECPCTSETKTRCLFLHGIGVHTDIGLVDAYPEYWGAIETMLPCCADVKFAHLNTVDAAWYDELFAERVCDALLAVASNKSFTLTNTTRPRLATTRVPVVENTVVVAHSTGNLHLASALLYQKCQLDRHSTKWIAIQGPMKGTNTANRVMEECNKPASQQDTLVQTVVRDFELCPVKKSTKSLALAHSPGSCQCLDKLYDSVQKVYQDNVFANLCGTSAFGLTSTSSPKFVALAKFSNHSSTENDGVVVLESCAVEGEAYQPTYRNRTRFYKAAINHDDGRLVHGDGLWGDDRKPIKWLQCQF